jgi:indoleamine 2,3-dioxygenase
MSRFFLTTAHQTSVLPVVDLTKSEVVLRRAHHVLAWILHFYIQTLPPDAEIRIPPPLAIPLLQVCAQLQLPPLLSYSDNVLYNWSLKFPSSAVTPALDNLRCQTLFTGTSDEEEFYLCSARIELRGVEALGLMQATMDEMFVGDAIAVRRIAVYLQRMATVIKELRALLLSVRDTCNPKVYYQDIRPWLRGADSVPRERKWTFEGIENVPGLQEPMELSGPSAGQSSLIHALTIFLGVDVYSHSGPSSGPASVADKDQPSFLERMQSYMPRHHRAFLAHLAANPRPVRGLVLSAGDPDLLASYNAAVLSLKEFRDAHMVIVALYIIGPASKAKKEGREGRAVEEYGALKGTGGTDMAKFLKDVRDRTAKSVIPALVGHSG